MTQIADLCGFLETFAPHRLAEDWDNVGLLVGDSERACDRVMTCLTVTPATVAEAIDRKADLVVSHHPFPFRPLKRITRETTAGSMLLDLIAAGVAIYSPHTAFDSAKLGINSVFADRLGLINVRPLTPRKDDPDQLGAGRQGEFSEPITIQSLAERLGKFVNISHAKVVGDAQSLVRRVAIACGAAGEFLGPAIEAGNNLLITGETSFHTCLEAEAQNVGLLLTGHFASERFGVEHLAGVVSEAFPEATVWCSETERDPVKWLTL
ncbi:MAG: Nif3-like dinuclear metal center hexameric protein [bacterium]|nr:Nif3-like dinuclear metal center hexameric protein [bacterium]